jgi:hypothetical protein
MELLNAIQLGEVPAKVSGPMAAVILSIKCNGQREPTGYITEELDK